MSIKISSNNNMQTLSVVLVCMALAGITLAVYFQAGNHQFLSFDDKQYVTGNPHVTRGITGATIMWAFTSIDAFNWHPITWLSHMTDVQLFGMNPRGHHLTNIIIHTTSSVLLLLLLFRCTGSLWQSSFVAALFALHPLHVESVAWVAERKDVLSALFWFLTLLMYAEFSVKRTRVLYTLSLFCFVLGLMSKPMIVTLPIVMLLLDFWPLGRYRCGELAQEVYQLSDRLLAHIKEKIPFIACSLLSGFITLYAQHTGGAMIALNAEPFRLRIENALISYVTYIGKTAWPHDLAVYYPFPVTIPPWQAISSLVVLLLVSAAAIRSRRRYPYVTVGWLWFLITLAPVIGLVQVGGQSMADRYSYLPVTGLFIVVAWGVPDLTKGLSHRNGILALLAGAVIIVSAAATWEQLGYWQDSISLYERTLQVTSGNYLINYNLGVDHAEKGNLDAAIRHFQEAIRINPNYAEAHNNLGVAFAKSGDPDAAIREYRTALVANNNDIKARFNGGNALAQKGDLPAAIREYQAALRIDPDNTELHMTLGSVLAQNGDLPAAIREYRAVIWRNPDMAEAHNNLGVVLAQKGDQDAAILEYRASLGISPNNADAHNNLGVALTRKGDLEGAIQEYRAALTVNQNHREAEGNLKIALTKKEHLDHNKTIPDGRSR